MARKTSTGAEAVFSASEQREQTVKDIIEKERAEVAARSARLKALRLAKPDVFYQMVERSSYPPYLDAFARKRRPGWTVWGNGIAKAA